MSPSLEAYKQVLAAFDGADLHVQVELQYFPRNFDLPSSMLHVVGKIVRIFRAPRQLEIGSIIEFDLPVVMREKGRMLDTGRCCYYEELLLHPYVEVCLNGAPPLCHVVEDFFDVIPEPTEVPIIHFERDINALKTNKQWWKFW